MGYYNEHFGRYYKLYDIRVKTESNKEIKVEYAKDITQSKLELKKLSLQHLVDETKLKALKVFQTEEDTNKAIESFLSIVGNFYKASRAYIFDFDYEKKTVLYSYEWCKEGVSAQIDNFRELPIEYLMGWIQKFETAGEFYLSSIDYYADEDKRASEILKQQGISSLLAAPLKLDGKIVGFLGVDDPSFSFDNFDLLKAMSFFVAEERRRRFFTDTLRRLSFEDVLTGLYNRNKLLTDLEKYRNQTVNNVGVIFIDINGLKKTNDKYGHDIGDKTIISTGKLLESVFGSSVFRIGGDEFLVLVLDTMESFFKNQVIILKEKLKNNPEVNIAVGTTWIESTNDIHDLIKKSDSAMYEDKRNYYRTMRDLKV